MLEYLNISTHARTLWCLRTRRHERTMASSTFDVSTISFACSMPFIWGTIQLIVRSQSRDCSIYSGRNNTGTTNFGTGGACSLGGGKYCKCKVFASSSNKWHLAPGLLSDGTIASRNCWILGLVEGEERKRDSTSMDRRTVASLERRGR